MIELGTLYAAARRDTGEYVLLGDAGQVTFRCDDAVTAESLLAALAPLADLVTAHNLAADVARRKAEERGGHSVRVGPPRLSVRLADEQLMTRAIAEARHFDEAREYKW